MGGWSGGVYSRFRNWVTDKANSINPQASLFDQEDDGFAAGLNNCVTKDGLNKPSSAMDWNGQNLTGVLNLANTGTVSFMGGKVTGSTAGNLIFGPPTSGTDLIVNNAAGTGSALVIKANDANGQITFAPADGAGAYALALSVDATGGKINVNSNSRDLELQVNSVSYIQITTAGVVQAKDAGGTFQTVGFYNIPLNLQVANYTAVLADANKSITSNTGSAVIFTIPSNASVPYPVGTTLTFTGSSGSGIITISINTDTLILAGTATTGSRTLASAGIATAIKIPGNTWLISGAGLT